MGAMKVWIYKNCHGHIDGVFVHQTDAEEHRDNMRGGHVEEHDLIGNTSIAGLKRAVKVLREQGERDRAQLRAMIEQNKKLGRTIHEDANLVYQAETQAEVWERMASRYQEENEQLKRDIATIADQCDVMRAQLIMYHGDGYGSKGGIDE